jgi:DNA-binding GntR family transcriptional regulator
MHTDALTRTRMAAKDERIAPIEQDALGEQVYRAIREQIISGRLRPGQKLSDLRLSDALHVSRTPVREALYRLAQEGVVQVTRRRGFAVTSMTAQDVRELYEIRLGLELMAVRLGGPRLDAATLARIRVMHDTMAVAVRAGAEGAGGIFHLADRELHRTLLLAAQNRRLVSLREGLEAQLEVLQIYGLHIEPLLLLSIDHHAAILDALDAGDWPAAERAMSWHITQMQARALAIYKEQEE